MVHGIDRVGELLDELSLHWHVELTALELVPDAESKVDCATWRLVITSRRPGAFKTHSYTGTLAAVVARAWAGERGD